MSKIYLIYKGRCYEDLTLKKDPLTGKRYRDAADASRHYSGDGIQVVDAPNHVFLDWTYDPTRRGDDRFRPPQCPEGWRYDDRMMTIYNPVDLREKEREQLYAEYDAIEGKMAARVACGIDAEESLRKLTLISEYKWAVGQTQYQAGYPDEVEYPEPPDLG
jgi:hypothetical protein